MSKDEPSARGLLSKMVRFVRNPTVNWNALDSIETERESQYSKQVLKDMLERKRRNDFIRRREFDQLRKLRQRDALNNNQRAAEQPARASMFHSTLTSPDERAVTMRKIDEIEAQMSRTWWKGQGATPGAPPAPPPPPGPPRSAPDSVSPHTFAPTAPLSMPTPLSPVRMQRQGAASGLPVTAMQPLESAALLPAVPQAMARVPVLKSGSALPFLHNPDLEEAALRFANGDSAGAEASLLEVLAQRASDPAPQQFEVWMTLFDLYRATAQQERFDSAGLEFAARFHRSGPLWFSLPEQLGLAVQEPEPELHGPQGDRVWNCPSHLTTQSVAALHAWLERNHAPWTMVWGRLTTIDESTLPALTEVFLHWADQPVHLVFTDAEVLQDLLQSHTVSGDRSSNPQWWRLRMAALRFMNQPDDFEMVALDYCVTYEVSPPSWQIPECTYRQGADAAHHENAVSPPAQARSANPPSQNQELLHKKQWSDSTTPAMLSGSMAGTPVQQGLQGHVEGDAGELLDALAGDGEGAVMASLHIDCERLIRVDFAAAGSVLNWTARQQAMGRAVSFERMNRMVAVFFNVIGINEYAAVEPRKD